MKARVRNALWVASAVVGLALYLLPSVVVLVFFALLIAAMALTIPIVPRVAWRLAFGLYRERRLGPRAAPSPWSGDLPRRIARGRLPGDRK